MIKHGNWFPDGGASARPDLVGRYLGGYLDINASKVCMLYFVPDGIRFSGLPESTLIPTEKISGFEVVESEAASERFTATRLALLGPLGLAFKKKRAARAALIIVTDEGEVIFSSVDSPVQLRAKVSKARGKLGTGARSS